MVEPNIQMTPQYDTLLFTEIYDDSEEFIDDYKTLGIPTTISDASATTLFYLLYARFGNNPIANYDINQWKYKLFSVVFQYGPVWEKKLELQSTFRNMSEDDLRTSFKAIYNHAYNPSTAPSTSSLEELQYINDQNTNTSRRGRLEALSNLWDMLDADITEEFLVKFKHLFKIVVKPENPLLYYTEED